MLPMVVAGGLMIALSFVFGITAFKEEGTLAAALMQIGGETAFKLMVPLLAGYIAYSIADRPGLAPGMIGGCWRAPWAPVSSAGSLPASSPVTAAQAINRYVTLAAQLESLKPILIIPVAGQPVHRPGDDLRGRQTGGRDADVADALPRQHGHHQRDPARRAAGGDDVRRPRRPDQQGCLCLRGRAAGGWRRAKTPMAATMAAGMVPPMGLGIASFIARRKFAQPEREAGKASLVLGLCFISEGAIPFMAKDPLRVIPTESFGGALTGALSMYFGCKLMAPARWVVRAAHPQRRQPRAALPGVHHRGHTRRRPRVRAGEGGQGGDAGGHGTVHQPGPRHGEGCPSLSSPTCYTARLNQGEAPCPRDNRSRRRPTSRS